MSAPISPRIIAVNTAMLWVTTLIAATALWPIYQSRSLLLLIAVTLPVGSLLAILGAVLRWPSFVMVLATLAVFLAIGVQLAVPSKAQFGWLPSGEGLRDLVTGVALGWKQLLTITVPVGSYEALLVPAFVLVLLTVVVGLSTALRARNGELAVLAPIGLFIIATAFGATYPSRPLDAPIGLMIAVLLWLVWFRINRRRIAVQALAPQLIPSDTELHASTSGSPGLRTAAGAAAILLVASTGGILAAQALSPQEDRTVLRSVIVQPFDPRDYISPLSGFRRYLQPALVDSVLFTVTGLPENTAIRIATLDSYDGIVFAVGSDAVSSESGSFTRVPDRFDQTGLAGQRVEASIAVRSYDGIWVPTIGQFEAAEFVGTNSASIRSGFFYNNVSGTAATTAGLTSGDSYALTALLPDQPRENALSTLIPGGASVPEASGVPAELTEKLDEYVTGVDGAGNRLVAMLRGLAEEGYISHGVSEDEPPSRSGHSADRLIELLAAPRMIGDAEQYAVAAALMARDLGFPSRVVFGFLPTSGEVRGGDVSAWIEVSTAQYGWVAIDPNPAVRPIPDELPEDISQVARPQTVVPPVLVEIENPDRQTTPESEQDLPPTLDPVVQALIVALQVVSVVALLVALAVSPFVVILAAKLRRRRIRRSALNPVDQISGGWKEFRDSVIDHGLSPAQSATRSEIAGIAGGAQSLMLAALSDRAVFAPAAPPAEDADTVWRVVDELQASLDVGLTRWQRFKASVSLRSLGGYSVTKLLKR